MISCPEWLPVAAEDDMKTFGLFQPGSLEPVQTYRGMVTVLKDETVTVLGEVGRDFKREIVAVIPLPPGWTVTEIMKWRD